MTRNKPITVTLSVCFQSTADLDGAYAVLRDFNEQVQQLLSAVGKDRQAYCSRGACEAWC